MTTPAEQYRTLVSRLESIQEAGIVSPGMAQSATNAVTAPDASGAVLRALLTTGMSVVPEIVAFLMKNKSQLSPKCQVILQQFDKAPIDKAPSPRDGAITYDPSTTGSAPSPQPGSPGGIGIPPANPSVLIPGKSV